MSTIKAFKNVHKGKSAVLFLTGPTLNDYVPPEKSLVKVGVNTAIFRQDLDLDYFFIQDHGKADHQNSYISRKREYDEYRPNIAKFYGTTLSQQLRDSYGEAGAIPYCFSHGNIVTIGNARIEDPKEHPVFSSDFENDVPAAAGSIAFPALQFLLWTGVSKIYIVGADITDSRRFNEDVTIQNYEGQHHLQRWKEFEKWVRGRHPDVEIIPLNPVGLKGVFDHKMEGTMPKTKFRLHVLGIPHTVTSKDFAHCAFTQKVRRFCKFMKEDGHTVFHYGHERSEVECTEHITVTNDDTFRKCYGDNYDWLNVSYNGVIGDACHQDFTKNAIRELEKRLHHRDFILCFYGNGHKDVADHFDGRAIVVEPSIGCFKSFAPFRVFESYAVMNFILGLNNERPKFYDAVIPGFLYPEEFTYREKKEDWILYIGRIDPLKGVQIAIDACERTGTHLKMAGQGKIEDVPAHVEMLGYLDFERRADYMSRAKAIMCPSLYNEPFGYIAIEAAMCGTPVISTDWGGFVDTVLPGLTGYRCRNMDQFDFAIRNIDRISNKACREWAMGNFTVNNARERYNEYFKQVHGVFFGCDFKGSDPSRSEIVVPKRIYPER